MIFITSNEDLIDQIRAKKRNSALLIDLDHDGDEASASGNFQNLSFLAELTGMNSQNDDIYKDRLTRADENLLKSSKNAKKSADLVCVVCGDRAIGYNYDVLSCASCKTFFFRNAHHQSEKLRCLGKGHEQCSTEHSVRRKCQRCRLVRCFQMGMRKDFLLSAEEIQRKKKRIKDNQNLSGKSSQLTTVSSTADPAPNGEKLNDGDQLLMDIEQINDDDLLMDLPELAENPSIGLSIDDLLSIENIRSKFDSTFIQNGKEFFLMDIPNQNSSFKYFLQVGNHVAMIVINFFRQIDHFENLHVDDRFFLIKYNLCQLFPILKCVNYHWGNDSSLFQNHDQPVNDGQRLTSSSVLNEIRNLNICLVHSLLQSTEGDPIIISLLVIVSLFSESLPVSDDHQPLLKDPLAIHRAQSYYIQLLWNYLLDKYGELKTWQKFIQFFRDIFRIQSTTDRFRAFLRSQLLSLDDHDTLAPLLQTILHIS